MKLELNPSKMTVEELTDAINELAAQRERILEEKRQGVEMLLNLQMIDVFKNVEACEYDCYLEAKVKSGRRYKVPLNVGALESWQVLVLPKVREED